MNSKDTPDYIFFTIHGTAVVSPVQGYIIVYGVKDWSDSVDPGVYDSDFSNQMFVFKNNDMFMNSDIDMNNNKIINIIDPVNGSDVVNKHTLDVVETKITNLSPYTIDYAYRKTFDQYYSLTETSHFKLSSESYGVVIQGVKPNLFLGTSRFINNYNRLHGLQMNNGYINLSNQINQNTSFTIFVSLYLSSNFEIQFSNNTAGENVYYPSYRVSKNRLELIES